MILFVLGAFIFFISLFILALATFIEKKRQKNSTLHNRAALERDSPTSQRDTARDWKELVDREDVIIVDTETTGLAADAEVLEIAVIDTTGKTVLHEYAIPEGEISKRAIRVHGLTREALEEKNARPWPEIHEELVPIFKKSKIILAWNSSFDHRMIRQTSQRFNLDVPRRRWRCLMREHARGGRSQKLGNVAESLEISAVDAHSALGDVKMTLEIVRHADV